jgi:alpha-beta hydrolase superfamily lysophospholipase
VAPLRDLIADRELADGFVRDPLIGRRKVPLRFWRTANAYRGPAGLSCRAPLALFHPGSDAWTPTALSRAVFDRIEAPDKHFAELSNGSHAPFERPARDELVDATVRFLASSFAQGAGRSNDPDDT